MTEDDIAPVSQSRLGDYVECPRHYEYKRHWDIETPDETIRYLKRGTAMHEAIEETWLSLHPEIDPDELGESDPNPVVSPMGDLPKSPEKVQEYATDRLDESWDAVVPEDAYQTKSHYDYDWDVCRKAIAMYFGEGPGCTHLRSAIGSEVEITFNHDDLYLHGTLDLVRRTESGLQVIDYKSSLNGIISTDSYWGEKAIEEHRSGESHNPRYMKSLMQAALYERAATELDVYTDGMEVEFSFYGLRDDVDARPDLERVVPDITPEHRSMTGFLNDHRDAAWELIHKYAAGIREEQFEPEPWELIYDNACEDCAYQSMCPDYLSTEVSRIE